MLNTIISDDLLSAHISEEGLTAAPGSDLLQLSQRISNATSSQSKYAAWLINVTKGNITNEQLTECLREAFPSAKVGDRHGPHYASLSRSGKLKGCRYSVPKAGRSSSPNLKAKLARAEALIEALRDSKNMKEVRALMAEYDA